MKKQDNTILGNSPFIFKINDEYEGMRLDKFLKLKITGIQQSHLERLIGSGSIRVNQKKSKPSNRLNFGEQVSVPPRLKDQKFDLKVKTQFIPLKNDIKLVKSSLIKEENDFIALNKPSGIAVQGGSKLKRHIDGLIEYAFSNIEKHYLVHRLDRDTTGVFLIAKNKNFAKEISEYFKNNTIKKVYIAIVCGNIQNHEGTIDIPIMKERTGKSEKVVVDKINGLKSITNYKVLGSSENYSLVLLFPKTGRTHQIRVHLSHLGNPILGDGKYRGDFKIEKNINKISSLKLHCLQMSFPYKKIKNYIISARLNSDFSDCLKLLKLDKFLHAIDRYIENGF